MAGQSKHIIIDPRDNVATALVDLKAGIRVETGQEEFALRKDIAFGHKFALSEIPEGDFIVKYGAQIGRAKASIAAGEHVHVHNVEDITDEVRKK
ncbi:MAG: altronate hydrolase [Desulfobacteraceae bacterium]|nr:MAG: altronate hydrolase [Desulfobacteraceae bacterium]